MMMGIGLRDKCSLDDFLPQDTSTQIPPKTAGPQKETEEDRRARIARNPELKKYMQFSASCSAMLTPECRTDWTSKEEFYAHYLKVHHRSQYSRLEENVKNQQPFHARCNSCDIEFDDRNKWRTHQQAVHKKVLS